MLYARHDDMWSRARVLLILNLAIDWGLLVSFMPLLLYLQKVALSSLRLRGRMDPTIILDSAYKG